jgi:hypothetical protein
LPSIKRQKKLEALQELVHIKPDLKGKEVYFFPTLDKYFKGIIMYDGKEKKAYVYCIKSDRKFETFSQWINILKSQRLFKGNRSAIATIFLEPNPTCPSIASILCETDYLPYWKATSLINPSDILLSIKEKILPGKEFFGTAIQEISEGLEFRFIAKEGQPEKKLLIFSKSGLHSYEVYILNQIVQEKYLPFPVKAIKRTLDEIMKIIGFVSNVKICHGQSTIGNFIFLIIFIIYII